MKFKKYFIVILFLFGVFLLTYSNPTITGGFVGVSEIESSSMLVIGLIFIILSILILMTSHSNLEKIIISSSIKKHPSLLRLTQDAVVNQTVERELNHLIKELSKGNFEAGLGHPGHIDNTNIFYLRGVNGARLYYHQVGDNSYEIVGKSEKGRNQEKVINKLKEIYLKS